MKNRTLAASLLVALAALVVHGRAIDGSFHFDDAHAVADNPSIRSLRNLPRFFVDPTLFTTLPQNENYRPMVLVSYALTAAITGVSPKPFLFVNLLIHIGCAVLAMLLIDRVRRLLGRPATDSPSTAAFLGGLLFAVHPIFSECVNYVHSRSESLAALLTLGSLLAWFRGRDLGERGVWWVRLAALLLFAALFAKVVAGVVPFLVIGLELAAAERRPLRESAARVATLAAAVALFSILYVEFTSPLSVASRSNFSREEYLRSELPAILYYVKLFLWPTWQSADAAYPNAVSWLDPRVLGAGAILLATGALSAYGLWRRRWTGAALAVFWYLTCLSITSTVFPLAEVTNEHRPYLASLAWCALAGEALAIGIPWAFELAGESARRATALTAGPILIILSLASLARDRVWHSDEGLWKDVLEKAPGSTRAQMSYGLALMSRGDMVGAEPHLREAVRLAPTYSYALINLGQWQVSNGNMQAAVELLDRAINVDPNLFYAYHFRGLAALRLKEPPARAVEAFEHAVALSPNFADAWFQLAVARDAAGDFPGVLAAARRAVELRGTFDDRFELAFALLKNHDPKAALLTLEQLDRERPNDAGVQNNLVEARRMLGSAP